MRKLLLLGCLSFLFVGCAESEPKTADPVVVPGAAAAAPADGKAKPKSDKMKSGGGAMAIPDGYDPKK